MKLSITPVVHNWEVWHPICLGVVEGCPESSSGWCCLECSGMKVVSWWIQQLGVPRSWTSGPTWAGFGCDAADTLQTWVVISRLLYFRPQTVVFLSHFSLCTQPGAWNSGCRTWPCVHSLLSLTPPAPWFLAATALPRGGGDGDRVAMAACSEFQWKTKMQRSCCSHLWLLKISALVGWVHGGAVYLWTACMSSLYARCHGGTRGHGWHCGQGEVGGVEAVHSS